MKMKLSLLFICLCSALIAREPFHATVTVDNQSVSVSEPNLTKFTHEINEALLEVTSLQTRNSAASINLNLRGLLANAFFEENSTTLNLVIPQAGISTSFEGRFRVESLRLLKSFLKDSGDNNGRLLRAFAKFTPIDPIAGNPNSVLAQIGQWDYLLGRLSPIAGCSNCWQAQPIFHQFQLGAGIGRAFSKGFDTTIISSPLRYSYSPDGALAFIVDAPINLIKNGGAYSLIGSLGFGLRIPVLDFWSLTPTLRLGFGGSLDLVASGSFVITGLVSNFDFPIFSDYVLGVTNYVGYYSSTPLHLGGINFDYRLYNFIFKNGLSLTTCKAYNLLGKPINFSVWFTDTEFTGHRLFIDHYDEVGVSVIANDINPCLDYDCLSLGFSYQFGRKSYKGYVFNMAYQF